MINDNFVQSQTNHFAVFGLPNNTTKKEVARRWVSYSEKNHLMFRGTYADCLAYKAEFCQPGAEIVEIKYMQQPIGA
jgi:hypothetical protein